MYNEKFSHHIDRVKYTKDDGELEIFDPPYLDVRFSNVCNFSCRMCEHELSTAWYKDAIKLNYIDSTTSELVTPTNPQDLWEQIKLLIPTVEMIQWAGGEPLVTEEHWKILKNNIPNSELKIFKDCSHNVHLEIPDKFNQCIDDFLKK